MNDVSLEITTGPVPDGFRTASSGSGELVIHHKRVGGCLNLFMIVFLAIWTFSCVTVLPLALMNEKDPRLWWFPIAFMVGEVVTAWLVVYLVFCRKTYVIGNNEMSVTTTVGRYRKSEVIRKVHIRRLVQIQDGGVGEDSFPTWGLEVQTTIGRRCLVFRQPHEQSLWLGGVVAKWAGVDFTTVPEDSDG